jgi:hypothetical protein
MISMLAMPCTAHPCCMDTPIRAGDLAGAALAAQLARRLGQQEHAVHAWVREREPATVRVHGQ